MKVAKSLAALTMTLMLMTLTGQASAYAADEEKQAKNIEAPWGSAYVTATKYSDRVDVTASITAKEGCLKIKYKVRRGGLFTTPPENRDAIHDLARVCSDDDPNTAEGSNSSALPGIVQLQSVEFEACKIQRFKKDDCKTVSLL